MPFAVRVCAAWPGRVGPSVGQVGRGNVKQVSIRDAVLCSFRWDVLKTRATVALKPRTPHRTTVGLKRFHLAPSWRLSSKLEHKALHGTHLNFRRLPPRPRQHTTSTIRVLIRVSRKRRHEKLQINQQQYCLTLLTCQRKTLKAE